MQKEIVRKELVDKIGGLLKEARKNIAIHVNAALLFTYMKIGEAIVKDNCFNPSDADKQKKTLKYLSRILTKQFGKGFSVANLHNIVIFYIKYQNVQTLSEQLSWSHYCELLTIRDDDKRKFYEIECANSRWSVRELRRQIDSALFERIVSAKKKDNPDIALQLANKGNEIYEPEDILKDPYVLEFVDMPEPKHFLESDLEAALVKQIEKFMLELGKGFMFVGTQQRVTFNNVHYYADMVFYNKILKSYVLIELKSSKFIPQAVGQLNMYLNYYAAEINDEDDNPPIGIILCTDKGNVDMQYALGGLNNNIFAAKYVTHMPKKEDLIAQVEMITNKKTIE